MNNHLLPFYYVLDAKMDSEDVTANPNKLMTGHCIVGEGRDANFKTQNYYSSAFSCLVLGVTLLDFQQIA